MKDDLRWFKAIIKAINKIEKHAVGGREVFDQNEE